MSCALVFALTTHLIAGDWQDLHPGVECDLSSNVGAAAFLNSENRLSLAGYFTFRHSSGLSLDAGLATGYSGGPVVPMVRLNHDSSGLFVVPAYNQQTQDVGIVLGKQWSF